MNSITTVVEAEIALVSNAKAREALYDSYADASDAVKSIERFFEQFTSRNWSDEGRRLFFRNWRSPGTGAASFCALTFRLLEAAEKSAESWQRELLYRCATRLSEVSHEDVGIGGTDHQRLYDDFATRLSGSDERKLDRYYVPGLKRFLGASRHYRQNGDDLGRAMIISLPEELYNHGEFSFAAAKFSRWHRAILRRPEDDWKDDLRFIHDHLGDTERGHFASLVQGFEDYCAAVAFMPNWDILRRANVDLLEDMAEHYRILLGRLVDMDTRDPSASREQATA
ncbi:hypothetical protein [Burkholderia multivorans]|uniref:hypothetical protein n=1 Tax=Burkholderia multivorans TaxID=87883 RepID=UPI001C279B2C|nr:hypothetical protein [Burkholderia multivorans]MBU9598408.1 hypothetical protein [Burkholderia multivorans]